MHHPRCALVLLTLAGCASATPSQDPVDAGPDGPLGPRVDAALPIDAPSIRTDAPGPCVTTQRNLLVNGDFDATPLGTGWMAVPFAAGDTLMATQGNGLVQSQPNGAWLGGLSGTMATDVLYQDLTIPPSTTELRLTGQVQIRTAEFFLGMDDTARIELVMPGNNTVLATARTFGEEDEGVVWVPLDIGFPNPFAGQAVRLRLTSVNDSSSPTSFFFDTLALTATVCE